MRYSFGTVLLLHFPFSDASRAKKRPALVLLDTGDADILVARISSQVARDTYDITFRDWQAAGLLLASNVRVHKLATLDKSLVIRSLGELSSFDKNKLSQELASLWNQP